MPTRAQRLLDTGAQVRPSTRARSLAANWPTHSASSPGQESALRTVPCRCVCPKGASGSTGRIPSVHAEFDARYTGRAHCQFVWWRLGKSCIVLAEQRASKCPRRSACWLLRRPVHSAAQPTKLPSAEVQGLPRSPILEEEEVEEFERVARGRGSIEVEEDE